MTEWLCRMCICLREKDYFFALRVPIEPLQPTQRQCSGFATKIILYFGLKLAPYNLEFPDYSSACLLHCGHQGLSAYLINCRSFSGDWEMSEAAVYVGVWFNYSQFASS